jgi:hypothetical protein
MQTITDYDYVSAKAFLSATTIMDNLDIITLEQLKARPKGSAFLGVTNCQVPGHLLSINRLETQIIVDSGSDITLISLNTLSKLSPRPKPKVGEEIEPGQIPGKLKISTYVELPIYFRTDQGPVLMNVEAYAVPKMAPSFILGNDFTEQYQLLIIRNDKGTRLIFGNSGRSIQMHSSIFSTKDLKAYAAQYSMEAPLPLPLLPNPSKFLRLQEAVTIKPHTGLVVKVQAQWPENQTEAFVEEIPNLPPGLQVLELIISQETPEIIIFNVSLEELSLPANTPLGKLLNPNCSLDKPNEQRSTMAFALKALVQGLGKPTEPIPDEHPGELEGGPKSSEIEPDPVSSKDFLDTLDINPELSPEQRKQVEKVLLKRKEAFGLDGCLGHHASKFEIRLKEGAEPVSMRPYHASPRN